MEQAILTTPQKKVIAAIATDKHFAHYYLTGGTALAAYHLQHRVSDDLDFFTPEETDTTFLHAFAERLKKELGATQVRFQPLHDRRMFFFTLAGNEEFKVEFSRYPFPHLATPLVHDGVNVDSARDIAANKLMTVLDRFEPKDFADLYFLLQQRDLEAVRQDAEKKFGVR
jgi:predicted nucleotidyltransferase component of viral defense system